MYNKILPWLENFKSIVVYTLVKSSVEDLFYKYYAGDKARQSFITALSNWQQPQTVLYPGSFIHVTASFEFPVVVFVDNDRNAKKFFSKMGDVISFVEQHKVYDKTPKITYHGLNYEADIPEQLCSFDLLISLYAGFISKHCKKYLKIGGILCCKQ